MKLTLLAAIAAFTSLSSAAPPPSPPSLRRQGSSTPSIQAGGIFTLPSGSSDTITSITGTFTVPHLSIPISGPHAFRKRGIYAFSIWLGIGGTPGYGLTTSCPGANPGILRAGIDLFYNGFDDNPMTPFAWYEGGPRAENGAFGYAGFGLESGDLIRITVSAEGNTLNALMENFGAGVEGTAGRTPLQREQPTYGLGAGVAGSLCRTEAAWMVEDHMTESEPSVPVIMPNFTSVEFREMGVKTKVGGKGEVKGVKLVDVLLGDQGGRITECAVVGDDGLGCKRLSGGS